MLIASGAPLLIIVYAMTGNGRYLAKGVIFGSTSAGAMGLYHLSALNLSESNTICSTEPSVAFFGIFMARKSFISLALCGIWLLTIELGSAAGHLLTDKEGRPWFGWLMLSATIWFNIPGLYAAMHLRDILSLLKPQEKASYLASNIIKGGN